MRGGAVRQGAAVALALASPAWAQYPDPPAVLADEVRKGVAAVLDAVADGDEDPSAELEGVVWSHIVFEAVADAAERSGALAAVEAEAPAIVRATVRNDPVTIRNVATYNFMAATEQTDKQLGAPASSSGTTTLIEKPSFSSLMALAVEHGAIEQQKNGTALTLSTTPYVAAFAFAREVGPPELEGTEEEERHLDTAANYERYGWLDRLGLAGTFALQENENETGDDDQADDFSSFSAKLRLVGDRSTRSSALHEKWIANVQPAIQQRLNARTAALARVFNAHQTDGSIDPASAALEARRHDARGRVTTAIDSYLAEHQAASRADKEKALTEIVYRSLQTEFLDPITAPPGAAGRIDLTAALRGGIREAVSALIDTGPILTAAQKDLATMIEEHRRSPLLSLGYTLHRQVESTDYSEVSLLCEGTFGSLDVVGNAALSFNHDPDSMLDQETVRDYGGGVSFEWDFRNFLTGFMNQGSSAPVTAALSGKVSYLEDTGQTIGTAQLLFGIPLGAAFNLPLSFSYSSATEGSDESELRANVGFNFDSDKLAAFALLRQVSSE